jgi:cytochrome c oxidase subunit 2
VKSRLFIFLTLAAIAAALWSATAVYAAPSSTSIFSDLSTPAGEVNQLSWFVLAISALIFVSVSGLLLYAVWRFRARPGDSSEPPQVFGSMQIELSWTIIPTLIVVVLFLATARVVFSVQDAPKPPSALDVTVIGHQFWWEFRYPQYNVVAANELHLPVSTKSAPRPAFMKLTSADVIHSFWVPQLAGKTDLLPNRVNEMWIDPQKPGVYVGQCAQFCGVEHAKMLLRVYVDTPEQFQQWIANQQRTQAELDPAQGAGVTAPSQSQEVADAVTPRNGQRVFEQQACINCHAVAGTVANGQYGPDLTHLMSRATLAAGAAENTPENSRRGSRIPIRSSPDP